MAGSQKRSAPSPPCPVPRPTCGRCPALGSGHPGAGCQLVLKQLLVEAIFRGVTTHQEQRQASAGSKGVTSNCWQLHGLRGLGDEEWRSRGWGAEVSGHLVGRSKAQSSPNSP